MKKIKNLILLNLILIIFVSCTSIKEGLTNQKKKSSDEFFVEKKLPLVIPPNYGELPSPKSEETTKDNKNNIENLIGKSKDQTLKASSDENKSLKKTVLDKIKNN
ncbi:DUF3035 domain-containing protein [Candidatus Pelagibacter sp.]|jgi:hypothetical protein|nr:DUF3035 domain-containing protein [Candidatus Pelagibacter sp.]